MEILRWHLLPLITEEPASKEMAVNRTSHRRHVVKKRFMAISRWLHIYLSMASFAILFFFAVTGLTLNHTEWFTEHQRTTQSKGQMESAWLRPPSGKELAKLEIVEFLRRTHGIKGAMSDFRVEDAQATVSFKGPGYSADAFVNRETGTYELTEIRMGFFAVINDLHKGRDSGKAWGWMIDASAILMTLVSLSGMVLIFFLAKRRFSGVMVAFAGAILCYVFYVVWVP